MSENRTNNRKNLHFFETSDSEALLEAAYKLHDDGKFEEAIAIYRQLLALYPQSYDLFNNMSVALNAAGQHHEALQACINAIRLAPELAEAYANTGIALKGIGRANEAEMAYRKAISIKPETAATWSSLGTLLAGMGRHDEAATAYRHALLLKPDLQECRLKLALLIPPLKQYADPELADSVFMQALAELEEGTREEEWALLGGVIGVVHPFALAYRTGDHTSVLKKYGEIACRARKAWFESRYPGIETSVKPWRDKTRILIVSGQISNHSVWNVILHGLLKHLDRSRFDVIIYDTSAAITAESALAEHMADRYLHGRFNWVEEAINDRPDCIFYPETGMDPTTIQLATLRLAPLQIAGWGHPITTGLPTIDLYCSGELLERDDAGSDYTETLIRLPGVGACSILPEVAAEPPDTDIPDIPTDGSVTNYLICQQSAKLDPSFDSIYPRIAISLPGSLFWFVRDSRSSWDSMRIEARLARAFRTFGLDPGKYVRIVEWLPGERFLGLLDRMDVYLDTPAFSGYTTAWQALHRGLPIITLEGRFMRQRLAAGLLRLAGFEGTIAGDIDEYVLKAAALGMDAGFRRELRQILKKSACRTDRDVSVVRKFEEVILEWLPKKRANG